nr:MAG TPA: Major capsid protein [Microviridae sp.]
MANNYVFNTVPTIKHSRSRFDLSHSHKTAINAGDLIPFLVQEIYPGDSFDIDSKAVVRATSAFLKPVMDDCFLDMFYFFVPNRLVDSRWQAVMGENTQSAWAPAGTTHAPTVSVNTLVPVGSIADYMGIPTGMVFTPSNAPRINLYPFRAFALIWNDWFRDENVTPPMSIQKGSTAVSEAINANSWAVNNYTGMPPKVSKVHDYFTSALPEPQKGNAQSIVGTQLYPVVPLSVDTGNLISNQTKVVIAGSSTSVPTPVALAAGTSSYLASSSPASAPTNTFLGFDNLFARNDQGISVNDLRLSVQLQKQLERDARSGSRYIEYIRAAFGVDAGDYRLQRPEFLGGSRNPISIQQVPQTSQGTTESPLAELGAYSLSMGSARAKKGFVEHGFVIGVMCIRQYHTYQQGIERFWRRQNRIDYYDPVFQSIGEQPVYQNELYALSASDAVFGYQEAWADLRYRPNRVSGKMRSNVVDSLDIWHFGDEYNSAPVLNQAFINETPQFIDRTLAVPSTTEPQFILDIRINEYATRCLPTYSVPSLLDHH